MAAELNGTNGLGGPGDRIGTDPVLALSDLVARFATLADLHDVVMVVVDTDGHSREWRARKIDGGPMRTATQPLDRNALRDLFGEGELVLEPAGSPAVWRWDARESAGQAGVAISVRAAAPVVAVLFARTNGSATALPPAELALEFSRLAGLEVDRLPQPVPRDGLGLA
jgi:hypothetical protein